MNPETYFADTVAAGWAPRNPCTDERELAGLFAMLTRGDCISPLVIDSDVVYIDRNAKPEPGDVVDFALSSRGAEAQNSDLPPGQSPWKAGDRWCKLYGTRHGLDLLYDRHGGEATATLMTCESPDDTPILYPVRQIRRNGRLLYGGVDTPLTITRRALLAGGVVAPLALSGCGGSDDTLPFNMLPACEDTTSGAQLGVNSATAIHTASVVGPVNVNTDGGTSASPAYLLTLISVLGAPYDTTHVLTITGFMDMNAVAQQNDGYVAASTTSGLNVGAVATAGGFGARNPSTSLSLGGGSFAIEQTYSVTANTSQTYYIYGAGILVNSGSQAGSYINVTNLNAKVEVIKR
jgi:hypothetical protein